MALGAAECPLLWKSVTTVPCILDIHLTEAWRLIRRDQRPARKRETFCAVLGGTSESDGGDRSKISFDARLPTELGSTKMGWL